MDAQLQGKHPYSKSRSLCVHIQATVVRASDGQELYRPPILYRSEARKLKDWTGSDGRLLRQELDSCSKIASQALADDLVQRRLLTPQSAAPGGYGPPRPVIQ